MRSPTAIYTSLAVALVLAGACQPVEAASITFSDLTDLGVVVTVTGLESPVISFDGRETAEVSGLLRPATSPAPLFPGTTYATLTEPASDPFGPRISDVIRLIVGPIQTDSGGLFQVETVSFASDGFPGFAAILGSLPVGVPSVLETGALQDVTTLLGVTFPTQNLQILVASDVAAAPEPVPEPGTLSLIALGMGAAAWRKRRAARVKSRV